MNEQQIYVRARQKGMWPSDAEVLAKWFIARGFGRDKYYVDEWVERFMGGSAIAHMDLESIRSYRDALTDFLSDIP